MDTGRLESDTLHYWVSLDAILDTPLATIASLDSDFAAQLMQEGWETRQYWYDPEWESILPKAKFDVAWGNRDEKILKGAVITGVCEMLTKFMKDDFEAAHDVDKVCRHVLHLNLYPYQLQVDDVEMLKSALMHHLPYVEQVKTTSLSMVQLSPSVIKQRQYQVVVLEHLQPWLHQHHNALVENKIPGSFIVAPALLEKPIDVSELDDAPIAKEMLDNDVSPFDAMELNLVECVQLRFIKAEIFTNIIVAKTE